MGAWVPGRAIPGCLGCSPGPLGRVPGGSQVGFPAESLQAVGGYASCGFALKIMSILMSIFGRLGVDLGSVLGVIFGPFGTLVGQSWSQDRLRSVLTSKK